MKWAIVALLLAACIALAMYGKSQIDQRVMSRASAERAEAELESGTVASGQAIDFARILALLPSESGRPDSRWPPEALFGVNEYRWDRLRQAGREPSDPERYAELVERAERGETLDVSELKELHRSRLWEKYRVVNNAITAIGSTADGIVSRYGETTVEGIMESADPTELLNLRRELVGWWGLSLPLEDPDIADFVHSVNAATLQEFTAIEIEQVYPASTPDIAMIIAIPDEGGTSEQVIPIYRNVIVTPSRGIEALTARFDEDDDEELDEREQELLVRTVLAEYRDDQKMQMVDITQDGAIDPNESIYYLERYNEGDITADLNRDLFVDFLDLKLFTSIVAAQGSAAP